jgi:hypothetical protein
MESKPIMILAAETDSTQITMNLGQKKLLIKTIKDQSFTKCHQGIQNCLICLEEEMFQAKIKASMILVSILIDTNKDQNIIWT